MNYPSLSLSADDIERAFSGKNAKSLIKANPVKKDNNLDQNETTFKDGKTRYVIIVTMKPQPMRICLITRNRDTNVED